jgi:hypothetical protein
MTKSEEIMVNSIDRLYLRLVRSHIRFCATDEPEKLMSWLRIAYCATESLGSAQATLRRSPVRRAEEVVLG